MTLSNRVFFIDKNTGDPRMFDSLVISTGEVVERPYGDQVFNFLVFINHATGLHTYVLMGDDGQPEPKWLERQGFTIVSE